MRSSRTVALRATALAAVVYLLVSLVINAVAGAKATRTVDYELSETLTTLKKASASAPNGRSVIGYFGGTTRLDPGDDLDRVPVAYWWVPDGGGALPATAAMPVLPTALYGAARPATTRLGSTTVRVAGETVTGGRWVAAMSTVDVAHDSHVLEVAELAVLPLLLGGFFAAAYVIGRRASAPVEDARRRQLAFTADASHELRTPLSVIEAEVGLALAAERDAAEYRLALQNVSAEAKRLKSIVEELLWLARFDAGPRRPPSEEVDLSAVASASARRFDAVAAQRGVVITVEEAEPGRALVHAPPEWLDRLASVLVDNACRYTAAGTTVTVRVTLDDGAGSVLTVDDEGPGISEEQRDKIFERFHRATSVQGGSGLGLAIADAVVGATGGRWTVGTSPSGGARMQVSW